MGGGGGAAIKCAPVLVVTWTTIKTWTPRTPETGPPAGVMSEDPKKDLFFLQRPGTSPVLIGRTIKAN